MGAREKEMRVPKIEVVTIMVVAHERRERFAEDAMRELSHGLRDVKGCTDEEIGASMVQWLCESRVLLRNPALVEILNAELQNHG